VTLEKAAMADVELVVEAWRAAAKARIKSRRIDGQRG
jgi:hypothetical protein